MAKRWDILDWIIKDSGLNFFKGFALSLIFYILLCGVLIIRNSDTADNLQLILLSVPNLLLVVVTFAYVMLTEKLVKTNQDLLEVQTSPNVIANLVLEENFKENPFIDLIIENVGFGYARNISLIVNPPGLHIFGEVDFDTHPLIKNNISILGPKQSERVRLCSVSGDWGSTQNHFNPNIQGFQVIIKSQNSTGKDMKSESFDLDISKFKIR